jgi:hypothetical protein
VRTGEVTLEPEADADGGVGESGLRLCASGASATLLGRIAGIGTDLVDAPGPAARRPW